MPDDFVLFLVGIGVLILYLLLSAMTEMGTKLPFASRNRISRDD